MFKNIKKSSALLFIIISMVATSCIRDEENDNLSTPSSRSYEELIIGDWDCVHTFDHYYHEMGGNVWQDTTRIDGWTFFGDRWKFTSDGKWYCNAIEYGTFVISGDMFALTHPHGDITTRYNYKIKELTSTVLVLGETNEEVNYYDYDNIPDSTEIIRREYRYEFNRI